MFFGKAELLKPGRVYEFTIELYPTSLKFARGHRIRLDISSSNFPRFDVNPEYGEPLNENRRLQTAEDTTSFRDHTPHHLHRDHFVSSRRFLNECPRFLQISYSVWLIIEAYRGRRNSPLAK